MTSALLPLVAGVGGGALNAVAGGSSFVTLPALLTAGLATRPLIPIVDRIKMPPASK